MNQYHIVTCREVIIARPEIIFRVGDHANGKDKMEERVQLALRRLAQQSGRFVVRNDANAADAYELKCTISELLAEPSSRSRTNNIGGLVNKFKKVFTPDLLEIPDVLVADEKTMMTIACNLSLDLSSNGKVAWAGDGKISGEATAKELSLQLTDADSPELAIGGIRTSLLQPV